VNDATLMGLVEGERGAAENPVRLSNRQTFVAEEGFHRVIFDEFGGDPGVVAVVDDVENRNYPRAAEREALPGRLQEMGAIGQPFLGAGLRRRGELPHGHLARGSVRHPYRTRNSGAYLAN